MNKILICIKDKKSVFNDPVIATNELVAIRDFSYACKDEKSSLHEYPEDYCLYQIGIFNYETGKIEPIEPKILAEATTYANK